MDLNVEVKLTPEKAVIIGDTAVIADVHLGLENFMIEKGVAIPRMQIVEVVKSLRKVVEKYEIDRLVVAGDLKHEFGRNLPYEWEDVELFLKSFEDVELEIVRGNHDNYLATILAKHGLELKEEVEIHGWTVVHGHKECEKSRVIMGHEHPVVRIRFRGATYSYPCYLLIERPRKIVVLPAFSPLVSGSDVITAEGFLSPILKNVKDSDVTVYAVEEDVVCLGRLRDLKSAFS